MDGSDPVDSRGRCAGCAWRRGFDGVVRTHPARSGGETANPAAGQSGSHARAVLAINRGRRGVRTVSRRTRTYDPLISRLDRHETKFPLGGVAPTKEVAPANSIEEELTGPSQERPLPGGSVPGENPSFGEDPSFGRGFASGENSSFGEETTPLIGPTGNRASSAALPIGMALLDPDVFPSRAPIRLLMLNRCPFRPPIQILVYPSIRCQPPPRFTEEALLLLRENCYNCMN